MASDDCEVTASDDGPGLVEVVPVDADSAPEDDDLASIGLIESDHPAVSDLATEILAEAGLGAEDDPADLAAALFTAVRDRYRYDPYDISRKPDDYRAGAVARGSQTWCVPKAGLLSALARSVGIPARIGFADVKNHLQSDRLEQRMGTDAFLWHGFSVMWLGDRWLKASPAFNRELCQRFGTRVLEFDGRSDALLHESDLEGNPHMEYVNQRGVYRDLPLAAILATFERHYPDDLWGTD